MYAFPIVKRGAADAIAPLFDVAQQVAGESVQQTQIAGEGQAIDHARRAVFLIQRAAGIQVAVFHLAYKRVPRPLRRVADADGIQVGVVQENARPAADFAHDGAVFVHVDFVVPQLFHFRAHALAHALNVAVHAGNGHDVAEKPENITFRGGYLFVKLIDEVVHFLDPFWGAAGMVLEMVPAWDARWWPACRPMRRRRVESRCRFRGAGHGRCSRGR